MRLQEKCESERMRKIETVVVAGVGFIASRSFGFMRRGEEGERLLRLPEKVEVVRFIGLRVID